MSLQADVVCCLELPWHSCTQSFLTWYSSVWEVWPRDLCHSQAGLKPSPLTFLIPHFCHPLRGRSTTLFHVSLVLLLSCIIDLIICNPSYQGCINSSPSPILVHNLFFHKQTQCFLSSTHHRDLISKQHYSASHMCVWWALLEIMLPMIMFNKWCSVF